MSTHTYWIIDAFTTTAFKGNGAAVVVLDAANCLPDATLQNIAAEFNLSETAYVTPIDPEKGRFGLRWFTPKVEVPLCGHATLASASVLFFGSTVLPKNVKSIEFETIHSGVLTAKALPDGRIELEFPAGEATAVEDELEKRVKKTLELAFGVNVQTSVNFIGTGEGASYGNYMLIEVDADYDLENATVNPEPFRELAPQHAVIIVSQRGRQGRENFRSRVFCPVGGIPEDPVTGSAHSFIGRYWAKRPQVDAEPATEMVGKQVSARSGVVGVSLDGQRKICKLRGNATLVAKGEFYLSA